MKGSISMRTAGSVALAALTATLLLGLSAVAQGFGGYGVRPGQSNPADPATRAYFKPVIERGRSLSQSVIVSNTGASAVHLLVYPVDGLTGQTTGTVYANRGDPVRKAGRWVKLGVSQITVASGQQVAVGFTVRVPSRAKAGDHVAGIAFEGANPTTSSGRFHIKVIIREVIGVQIRVPGRASARLTLGALQLMALPGTQVASVVVGLGNAGLTLCKPTLAVALRGPHRYRRRVVRALDTVLPGDAVAYPLPWPGRLQHGSYSARAAASCPGQRVARLATVLLGKPLGVRVGPTRAGSISRGAIPAWILIIVALAGVGSGVALTYVRMARRHRGALAAAAGQNRNQLSVTPGAGPPATST